MFRCFSIFKFYKVVQQHSVSKVEVFMTELPLESDYQDLENKYICRNYNQKLVVLFLKNQFTQQTA